MELGVGSVDPVLVLVSTMVPVVLVLGPYGLSKF
jgi:hypothetical protein